MIQLSQSGIHGHKKMHVVGLESFVNMKITWK